LANYEVLSLFPESQSNLSFKKRMEKKQKKYKGEEPAENVKKRKSRYI
jgi:hypothetical protein